MTRGAAGLSGALAMGDPLAATEPPIAAEPAEEDVRYAISFRADFGFQSDEPVRGGRSR